MIANKQLMLTLLALSAALMETLDMTIVNVALPDIQGAMSASPDEISWVLTSYLVSTGIFMPLTGFMADKFGRKFYFELCIVGFTLASFACGASNSLQQIVIGRIFQGAFGAGLLPISQLIMIDAYPAKNRSIGMTIWGMGVMLGPIFGPSLGGVLIDHWNWRWIFFINIPVGVIGYLISSNCLTETTIKKRFMDWKGLALLAIGIGCLQITLDRGNTEDWFDSSLICGSCILSFLALISFVYYCRNFSQHPIFNLKIFEDQNFSASCIIMSCVGAGVFAPVVLVPLTLSILFNYSSLDIGISMMSAGVGTFISLMLAHFLSKKIPARIIIAAGVLISGITSYIYYSTFNLDMDIWTVVYPQALGGIGLGLIVGPLFILSTQTLPKHLVHEAAGLFSLVRVISNAIGVALAVTFFTRGSQQFHEYIGKFINPYNENLRIYLSQTVFQLQDPITSQILGVELAMQAQMNSIINVYYYLIFFYILTLPLVFLLKNTVIENMEMTIE